MTTKQNDGNTTVSGLEATQSNPVESLDHPIRLGIFLVASVLIVFELGLTEQPDWKVRAITWWELIALLNTLVLSMLYFADLRSQAKRNELHLESAVLFVPIAWLINNGLIIWAFVARFFSDLRGDPREPGPHITYCLCVALSFIMFAFIDYASARVATARRKIREYWVLFLFVDSPAAIAFIFVFVYMMLTGGNRTEINWHILSGAIVMQMLIADALFLLVASNFHNWYLVTKLPSRIYL